jgi:hypothetical protein
MTTRAQPASVPISPPSMPTVPSARSPRPSKTLTLVRAVMLLPDLSEGSDCLTTMACSSPERALSSADPHFLRSAE